MTKKKSKLKVTIDTSTCKDIKARLHRESVNKLQAWQAQMNPSETAFNGSRKGIKSILTRATNKSKTVTERLEKASEARKLKSRSKEATTK